MRLALDSLGQGSCPRAAKVLGRRSPFKAVLLEPLELGTPVVPLVPFCPFYLGVSLLKLNNRKKGTLIINRLLGT